jgi:hypothetical protein
LTTAVLSTAVFAMAVVADGEASIQNDDLSFARQVALRRAMVSAVEQAGGFLQSTTVSTSAGIQERSSLSSRNRVRSARILSETAEKGTLRITAEIDLDEPGSAPSCDSLPRRTVVVTSFPLEYPEQVSRGSFTGWSYLTADELTAALNRGGRLLAASASRRIAFNTPESAPEPTRNAGIPELTQWAKSARAQYVVAGVFRDIGKATRALIVPERQMLIEAFIYDGFSGELLAKQQFSRQLLSIGGLPSSANLDTRAFRESRFGQSYLELIQEIGEWAEQLVGCLPFAARVIRADGRTLYIDVGSDSGLEPGMEFLLTREAKSIKTADGDTLGQERRALGGGVVKSVQARYSTVELTAKKNPPTAHVGDVLFGY